MLAPDTSSERSSADHRPLERSMPQLKPLFGFDSIRRHKRLLLLGCALGLLLGLLYTGMKRATFTASVELLVYNRQISTGHSAAVILPGSVDIPLLQNQIELLRSRTVLAKVIRAMDLTNDSEYFSNGTSFYQTLKELISPKPVQLVDEQTLSFVVTLESLRRKLQIRRLGMSHIVQIRFTASEPVKALRIANEVAQVYMQERTRLLSEALAIRELYQGLGPSANVISESEAPSRPDGPSNFVIVLGAALLGLGAGVIGAILLELLNNTIRNPEQLERFLGVPCLGCVPLCGSEGPTPGTKQERRIRKRQRDSTGTVALGLRRLLAYIQEPCSPVLRSLGVTSATPGEGTTTIAINLARLMTLSGKRVLLMSSAAAWKSAEARLPQEQADVRPAEPDQDSGSLGSGVGFHVLARPEALDEHVHKALDSYDCVIVDFPCLASGAQVRAAAGALDAFLLVVKWGGTDCELARQAFQSAGEAQAKFIGAVLNMADRATTTRYGDQPMVAHDASAASPRPSESTMMSSPSMPATAIDE
jgi:polysaccharide biosynthesis transport protein